MTEEEIFAQRVRAVPSANVLFPNGQPVAYSIITDGHVGLAHGLDNPFVLAKGISQGHRFWHIEGDVKTRSAISPHPGGQLFTGCRMQVVGQAGQGGLVYHVRADQVDLSI